MTRAIDLSTNLRSVITAREAGPSVRTGPGLPWGPLPAPAGPHIEVDAHSAGHILLGFGGAFTEAGAHTLARLSPARREEVLRAYFDLETGSGYTVCRTHINSCDFSLGNYAYNETDGDFELRQFDISRDRQGLIPMIRDAQRIAGRALTLVASPWSPPAWMKTNGQMNHGGKLRPDCRKSWARYFARYIRAYAKESIGISAVTVQNEPQAVQTWDSCIYTHEEQRDFVRDYLGPTLQEEGLGHIKILVWDHNRDEMFRCAQTILSDPDAAAYVWGVGFHWYSGNDFHNVARVRETFPDMQLVFTEGCQEHGVNLGSWELGERYAHEVIGDLNHGANAWIDWNMVLDLQGGPNHVGNYCDAAVIVDTEQDRIHYQNAYYYLRHFSRYLRPGARHLKTRVEAPGLEATAARNTDGTVAVVVLNRTDSAISFVLRDAYRGAVAEVPGRGIATYRYIT